MRTFLNGLKNKAIFQSTVPYSTDYTSGYKFDCTDVRYLNFLQRFELDFQKKYHLTKVNPYILKNFLMRHKMKFTRNEISFCLKKIL